MTSVSLENPGQHSYGVLVLGDTLGHVGRILWKQSVCNLLSNGSANRKVSRGVCVCVCVCVHACRGWYGVCVSVCVCVCVCVYNHQTKGRAQLHCSSLSIFLEVLNVSK